MEAFRKIYPEEYYRKFLVQNVRPDGRGLTTIRKTVISTGSLNHTADGSSFVKIGSTTCVCGIRGEIGKHDSNVANIAINVELLPLCSSKYSLRGRPPDQAQLLGVSLHSLLKNTLHPTDLECKVENEDKLFSWYLWIDVYCLDFDGNLFDASLIAAVGALKNASLAQIRKDPIDGLYYSSKEKLRKLQLKQIPFSLTFCMVDYYILSDPTIEEENMQNGSFTIVVNQAKGLLSIFKPNGLELDGVELKVCLERTNTRASHVLTLLESALPQSD